MIQLEGIRLEFDTLKEEAQRFQPQKRRLHILRDVEEPDREKIRRTEKRQKESRLIYIEQKPKVWRKTDYYSV